MGPTKNCRSRSNSKASDLKDSLSLTKYDLFASTLAKGQGELVCPAQAGLLCGGQGKHLQGLLVCPIRTARNSHSWHLQAWDKFSDAAEALILGEVTRPPPKASEGEKEDNVSSFANFAFCQGSKGASTEVPE